VVLDAEPAVTPPVQALTDEVWVVQGRTGRYLVDVLTGQERCNCQAGQHTTPCHHVAAVRAVLARAVAEQAAAIRTVEPACAGEAPASAGISCGTPSERQPLPASRPFLPYSPGSRLLAARKSRRLNQQHVAEESGISVRALRDLEYDRATATPEQARALATVLGIRAERLLPQAHTYERTAR
jgi:hypothetical protein